MLRKFVLACAFLVSSVFPAIADDLDVKQKEMFSPSVQISGFCSGTIFHSRREEKSGEVETYVLTAKHCINEYKDGESILPVNIPIYDKTQFKIKTESYQALLKGRHLDSDLALLKLLDKQTLFENVAKIAPREAIAELRFGEPVHFVGFPLGLSQTYTAGTFGRIEVLDWPESGDYYYRSTPDIVGGSSGGGLYREKNGHYELIGVLTGGFKGVTFMNMFTPLDKILDYIDVADNGFAVNRDNKEVKKPSTPNTAGPR